MQRKYWRLTIMIAACACCLLFCIFVGHIVASPKQLNVLFIMCDDLNDYEGVFGGHPQARTPNIDRLAASGVVFANAHSNAPVCAPIRAAMFTGIYPHTSGNYFFDNWSKNPVLNDSKTIMQYMRDNGYTAIGSGKLMHHHVRSEWSDFGVKNYAGPVAYNGKTAVGHPSVPAEYSKQGLLDGTFASLGDVPVVSASKDAPGFSGWWDAQRQKKFRYVNDENRDLMRDEESAEWVAGKIRELDSANGDVPFFLAVGFSKPHTPLVAPQKYYDMFPLESITLPVIKKGDAEDCHYAENFPANQKGLRFYRALKASYPTIEEGLKHYIQAYLACVVFADAQVGKVLTALEQSRFRDNTIVVFTSDHGYDFGEKEYLFKNSLWENSTRVPFVIRMPGNSVNAGKKVAHPVSLIDLYPTLVDLCKLQGDTKKNRNGADLDGHSLKPLLENPSAGRWDGPNVALTMVHSPGPDNVAKEKNYAVRSRDWRYILYKNGAEELYDHRSDAHEWTNLADDPDYADKKTEMRRQLFELVPELAR
jgi:arylsulfatase A-like enzyme